MQFREIQHKQCILGNEVHPSIPLKTANIQSLFHYNKQRKDSHVNEFQKLL